MAIQQRKTDVVIVGMGASGGVAAYVLTKAGIEVVGLEAGGHLTGQDEQLNELAQPGNYNVFGRTKANLEIPTWRPDEQTPTIPSSATSHATPMMNAVGGTSIHYGTESWRLAPYNFRTRSATIERYGAGALPPNTTVSDWPFSYDDLEPYYDAIEYGIGISGKAGNIKGQIVPGGSPFEGPRSREYPLPPLRRSGYTELMADAARDLGWHPFPNPTSVHSQPFKGTPACTYCSTCGNGCFVQAKGSTDIHLIPEALKTKKLSLVTHARTTHVGVDANGRVTGVYYLKGGVEHFQPASVVILATFIYENIRLMLLSSSKAYPHGLSNNSGQVGKNYMTHSTVHSVLGFWPGRKLNRYSSLSAQGTNVDEWADDNFDHSGLGFISGGVFKAGMGTMAIGAANSTPPSLKQTWGSPWKAWVKQNANSVGVCNAQVDTFTYPENYLDLDPVARDPQGFPVVRITFNVQQNEIRCSEFLFDKLQTWMKAAGASETWVNPGLPVKPNVLANHAYGGARMGDDPNENVLDGTSFSHEAPNLAVLGGAAFPTTGGRNPTLTIQAMAWRTADHLVKNWREIAGS